MKKILTIILDGFGYREEQHGNAIIKANPSCFNELWNKYPHTTLYASEEYVGLTKGQFGNSEVGHMTIGAGRLIKQNETLIDELLDNNISENTEFLNMISYIKETEKTVHMVGLFSPGKVHSDMNHFLKMYDKLIEFGVNNINFHIITDGRDTKVNTSYEYIKELETKIKDNKEASISSICGRYYAMDRDKNWERTKNYYDLICNGRGVKTTDIKEMIEKCYSKNMTDEFLPPLITDKYRKIKDGDIVIWMNYRNDRAKQIMASLTNQNFSEFKTNNLENTKFYSFFPIDKSIPTNSFLETNVITNPLGIYLSKLGLTQARIAETEKYAHVTFFFDGTYNGSIEGCNKYLLPSPDVATYDLKPQMSAVEVTKKAIACMEKDVDFILVNYANPDMVGHTGNFDATVKAIMAVDLCLAKIVEEAENNFYKVIILADHGNADIMIDDNNEKVTTHTLSKVPFIITDNSVSLKDSGDLTNVAPTILEYMDIAKPVEMQDTPSLLKKN
jgi:2,3-bisphosphoglycerate-independent phosphoglycerate mutase